MKILDCFRHEHWLIACVENRGAYRLSANLGGDIEPINLTYHALPRRHGRRIGEQNRSRRAECQAAVVLAIGQPVDAILIRILQQEIVVEQSAAHANYGSAVVSGVPGYTQLRSKIEVGLVRALADRRLWSDDSGVIRKQVKLIQNQAASTRRSLHNVGIDRRTWHRRQVGVGASGVAHVIHAKADVKIWKHVERVADVALDACVEVSPSRAVER